MHGIDGVCGLWTNSNRAWDVLTTILDGDDEITILGTNTSYARDSPNLTHFVQQTGTQYRIIKMMIHGCGFWCAVVWCLHKLFNVFFLPMEYA